MAMNKSEQAAVEALREEMAFRWPTAAEPARSVAPPTAGAAESEGWDFNEHTGLVSRYWSRTSTHGRFYDGKKTSASQNARSLYSTEADALLAMRWAMCRNFAAKLRAVDRQIEALPTPPETTA